MLDKIVVRQPRFFLLFFSLACFFDIISPIGKVLLALIFDGTSKSRVFEKIYT